MLGLTFWALPLTHLVMAHSTVSVSQKHRQFHPGVLNIERGAVVDFVNDDDVTHHVYIDAPNMKFDSGGQPIGTTTPVQFNSDGTFVVRCAIHPTMRLVVHVK